MEEGMLELLRKIRWSTTYLAVGGTVMVMFLLVFAQSLFGSKTTHSQLRQLQDQADEMNRNLERIARQLEKQGGSAEATQTNPDPDSAGDGDKA